ncbi:MAG: hypothetical protein EOM67_14950 [Spirochaetia bacterium]|nr:hypothetical protein [Spirochaetia bacterium]
MKKEEKKPEMTTVYKVKKLKVKGSNNLQPMYNEEIAEWLLNDPDPNATLDKIKKEGQRKSRLSKDNPLKLMKEEMNDEEYINFWKDVSDLRKYYAIEYFKKGKKVKKSDFPNLYCLPQFIYNHNYKYWKKLITEKRFLEHPEFLIVDVDDIEENKPKDNPKTK